MPADEGHLLSFGHLHIDPANRPWLFGYCRENALARGMLHSTGHLAGFASQAAVKADEYLFHSLSPPYRPSFRLWLSMCSIMSDAALNGSGSTANVAPTTSFAPEVRRPVTAELPRTQGTVPSTVNTPDATT